MFLLNSNLLGEVNLILPFMMLSRVVLELVQPLSCINEFWWGELVGNKTWKDKKLRQSWIYQWLMADYFTHWGENLGH